MQHWTCEKAAAVLKIAPTKATQAVVPAVRKVVTLLIADSDLTIAELKAEAERQLATSFSDLARVMRELAARDASRPNSESSSQP